MSTSLSPHNTMSSANSIDSGASFLTLSVSTSISMRKRSGLRQIPCCRSTSTLNLLLSPASVRTFVRHPVYMSWTSLTYFSGTSLSDDTALMAQSPMEMQQLLDKVNAAGAQRLLKLNVKKTKLMTIGDVPDDINIRVNNDPVEKVKQFKYLGSLKSTEGDCSKDVNARIAMAKKRMCELTTLWKDRSIPVALKMRLVKTLVWTVLSYGAEAWTLKVRDERKITSMEMWLWRRMLRISWMEKRTDNSILQELEIKRELLGHVRKRKLTYYGHLCRDHGCQLTKTVVEGYVEGRRRRGRPETIHRQHQTVDTINDITVCTGCRRSQPLETARQSSDGG